MGPSETKEYHHIRWNYLSATPAHTGKQQQLARKFIIQSEYGKFSLGILVSLSNHLSYIYI